MLIAYIKARLSGKLLSTDADQGNQGRLQKRNVELAMLVHYPCLQKAQKLRRGVEGRLQRPWDVSVVHLPMVWFFNGSLRDKGI